MLVRGATSQTDLLERAVQGDAEAFGVLYREHLERVYRYVLYRVSDPHEAEDLTETIFLKAWEALPDYRLKEQPWAAWLFRIAANTVIDYYRTRHPHVELEEALPVDGPEPVERVSLGEEQAQVREAVAQLPAEQQQVLHLRFVEGVSHAEVARILGRTEGAVRVMQHRALVALAKLLERTSPMGRRS